MEIKLRTEKEHLINWRNWWAEKKVASEIDLAMIKKKIASMPSDLTEEARKKEMDDHKEGIAQAEKDREEDIEFLEVIDEMIKNCDKNNGKT